MAFLSVFILFEFYVLVCFTYAAIYRHQAREGEPRDYDLSHDPVRDLRKSTYRHLGTVSTTVKAKKDILH
jgi:Domain of unknown function (DUF4572)